MSSKTTLCLSAFACIFLIAAFPLQAQELFDSSRLASDSEKVLKDYILTKPETDTKRFENVKKIVIPQFMVGFETTRSGSYEESGLLIKGYAELAGVDNMLFQKLTDQVTDIVMDEYRQAGYEVITPGEAMAHKNWSKHVKEFEAMPKTGDEGKAGTTVLSFAPTANNSQYPVKLDQQKVLGDYKETILAGGHFHFRFLAFEGESEFIGAAGSLTFAPILQAAGALGYAVVQKYRFGMYAGTFTKPLLFDIPVGAIEKVSENRFKDSVNNKNVLEVKYKLNVDPQKLEEAVLRSARIAAKVSVKNLQRVTHK